ncbi:putative hydrophobin precursor protein [Parachaetomium inaequale]|uniref:Hydrophobin protein n=1 Tax=Parachaetomium inaequale TaxID=2588326 RepID=A0AAN6PMP9_9PEZI|nr:putative hydrophobin precursor protein [Parachaetomium inaequale]
MKIKIKYTAALTAICFTLAAALPAKVEQRQDYEPCPSGLYSIPQCCNADVLLGLDLDCHAPSDIPTDAANFSEVCSAIGQRARCCVLPILEQGILCQTPAGVDD